MAKHSGPQMKLQNSAGRDLGTYPGATAVEAAEEYARKHGYPSLEQAEAGRFLSLERLTFTPACASCGGPTIERLCTNCRPSAAP